MLQIFYILFVIIFRVFSQDCDYVEIDGICYSVKGPVIQSYQDAECERYGLTFYNPMPEDQDILGSFGTGVIVWTNAKWSPARKQKKAWKKMKGLKKARYYRYDDGEGGLVKNSLGKFVKRGGYQSLCLGLDVGQTKHVRVKCDKMLMVLCEGIPLTTTTIVTTMTTEETTTGEVTTATGTTEATTAGATTAATTVATTTAATTTAATTTAATTTAATTTAGTTAAATTTGEGETTTATSTGTTTSTTNGICENDYEELVSEICYKLHTSAKTYDSAVSTCTAEGAILAEPRDSEQDSALITAYGSSNYWMGINDKASEGNFVYESDGSAIVYSNWHVDMPDNFLFNDHCVHYSLDYAPWNDHSCAMTFPFVCQIGDGSGTQESSCPTEYDELVTGKCYKRFTTMVNYNTAVSNCNNEGGILAEPRSSDEDTALISEYGSVNYWMGMNDKVSEGTFVYESDGASLVYTNWHVSMPDDGLFGGEDCVQYALAYSPWNDIPCAAVMAYICQIDL